MSSFERWKPAAPARVQLLLAAAMWTTVGAVLLSAGARWTIAAAPRWALAWLAGGLLLGTAKALLVFRRVAARTARRIEERGDGRCLGGFLSPASWLLVVAMILLGRAVRAAFGPSAPVGALYAAVGVALLIGSGWLWRPAGRWFGSRGRV